MLDDRFEQKLEAVTRLSGRASVFDAHHTRRGGAVTFEESLLRACFEDLSLRVSFRSRPDECPRTSHRPGYELKLDHLGGELFAGGRTGCATTRDRD